MLRENKDICDITMGWGKKKSMAFFCVPLKDFHDSSRKYIANEC